MHHTELTSFMDFSRHLIYYQISVLVCVKNKRRLLFCNIMFLKQAGRQGRSVSPIRRGFRVVLILIHGKEIKLAEFLLTCCLKSKIIYIYTHRKFRKAGVKLYVAYLKQCLRNSHGSNKDHYFFNVLLTVHRDISV